MIPRIYFGWNQDMAALHTQPSRLRRTLKWTGAVVCFVLIGLWALSYSGFVIGHYHAGGGLFFVEGEICQPFGGYLRGPFKELEGWRVLHISTIPATDDISIPLWLPLLFVAVPTAWAFWSDFRRAPIDHCPRCRYDLTGNRNGRCPECGRECDWKKVRKNKA